MPRMLLEALADAVGPAAHHDDAPRVLLARAARGAGRGAARAPRRGVRPRARAAPAQRHERSVPAPSPRTVSAILTGDFNFRPDDPLHARLTAPRRRARAGLATPGRSCTPAGQPATTACTTAPVARPFACDFIFATRDLRPRLRAVAVDGRRRRGSPAGAGRAGLACPATRARRLNIGLAILAGREAGVIWATLSAATMSRRRPAADRLPDPSTPVRAELHAHRHPLNAER